MLLSFTSTLSESVVMLMEGFFAETAVLDPHRLFLPAAFVVSGSPPRSALAGDILLPVEESKG